MPLCDLYHKNGEGPIEAQEGSSSEKSPRFATSRLVPALPARCRRHALIGALALRFARFAEPRRSWLSRIRPGALSRPRNRRCSQMAANTSASDSSIDPPPSPTPQQSTSVFIPHDNQPGKRRTQQTKVSHRFFSRQPLLSQRLFSRPQMQGGRFGFGSVGHRHRTLLEGPRGKPLLAARSEVRFSSCTPVLLLDLEKGLTTRAPFFRPTFETYECFFYNLLAVALQLLQNRRVARLLGGVASLYPDLHTVTFGSTFGLALLPASASATTFHRNLKPVLYRYRSRARTNSRTASPAAIPNTIHGAPRS